jgi:sec-independent protein translocase protein TatB
MDLSWSELLVVGIVALVIIGPKDLPGMFRELGRFTAKVRAMGREFNRAMESAAKESGMQDVANDLRKVANPKAMGLDAVRSAADKFEKWDPMKGAVKPVAPLTPPPMPPIVPSAAPAAPTAVAAAPGSATAALAEEVAAKKQASAATVAKLKAAKAAPAAAPAPAPVAATPEPAVKRGGRVRKKPEAGAGDPT